VLSKYAELGSVLAPPSEQLERPYWPERGNRLSIPDNLMRDSDTARSRWRGDAPNRNIDAVFRTLAAACR
jgi:hypothetical protein